MFINQNDLLAYYLFPLAPFSRERRGFAGFM
jgi:hypothetical protein